MKKISVNQNDLKIINDIVKENNVQTFVLKQENTSGIGYITIMEFSFDLNGRDCIVSIPIADETTW